MEEENKRKKNIMKEENEEKIWDIVDIYETTKIWRSWKAIWKSVLTQLFGR